MIGECANLMTLPQLRLTISFCLSKPFILKSIMPQPDVTIGYLVQCESDIETNYRGCVIGLHYSLELIKFKLELYCRD